jgi:cytochrome c biogenesis protein CcdA
MKRRLLLLVIVGALLLAAVIVLRNADGVSSMLWGLSRQGDWLLPLVVVAALLDSINPCAFSILLLTIAFLFSIGRDRSAVLRMGVVYLAGVFAAYLLIGLGILQALHLFNTPHFMAKVGAWLLIALGTINVINEFFPRFPIKLRIPHAAHGAMSRLMDRATIPTAFALGVLVGLCEFPCTGGPYLLVLGLLHDSATYAKGFGYLLLYNAIFVAPLVIILLISANEVLVEKIRAWQRRESMLMRFGGGIAMVILGALILLL